MITFAGVCICAPAGLLAQRSTLTSSDSVIVRAQRLIREGEAARGRALIDSLFRETREGTPARAQALYWRALVAADSAAATDDYITIIVDYALSPYAADALLHVGQIEYSRGAHTAAINHLQRLVLEHRDSPVAGEGWLWLGRARIANGDAPRGCIALDSAKRRIPSDNVELLNRVSFIAQNCRDLITTAPSTADTASGNADTAAKATRYSVQIGALKTKAEADRLVQRLKVKGHTARVDKLALYHVRIGAFATRTEATKLMASLKREKFDAIVVEVPRREP